MNIGITLTSSLSVGQEYIDLTKSVAELLAKNGFGIVYGGTEYGMMKELAESYKNAGGSSLTGVMSKELEKVTTGYKAFGSLDESVWVETIGERIRGIADRADGFIILPGGYGTLEEFGIILGAKANKMSDKPIVLLNYGGFYDQLIGFLSEMVSKNFSKVKLSEIVYVADSTEGLVEYFKNYKSLELPDKFA